MSTDTAPFSITYACQCPELRRRCPACIAFYLESRHESAPLEPRPVRRHKALPPRLVAGHADLVARIDAGESYTAIAQAYGISEFMLHRYMKSTGIHSPRAAIKKERFRALAPHILTQLQNGVPIAVVARQYDISPHAIQSMRNRAKGAQRTRKDT